MLQSNDDALGRGNKETPDIVLLDYTMQGMDGYETLIYLKEHHPKIKVIILSMHNDEKK